MWALFEQVRITNVSQRLRLFLVLRGMEPNSGNLEFELMQNYKLPLEKNDYGRCLTLATPAPSRDPMGIKPDLFLVPVLSLS